MKYLLNFLIVLLLCATLQNEATALTGTGLPNGCHGSEVWVNYGSPMTYRWVRDQYSVPHLQVIYYLSSTSGSYHLCWASFHGTMNTDNYGGSDNWNARLGDGRLEILIPKSLWLKYYSAGYSTSEFVNMFYLWTYWEK